MDLFCIHFNVNCTVELQFGRCDLLFALYDICMPLWHRLRVENKGYSIVYFTHRTILTLSPKYYFETIPFWTATIGVFPSVSFLTMLFFPSWNPPLKIGIQNRLWLKLRTRGPWWPCIAPLADWYVKSIHTKHSITWELV